MKIIAGTGHRPNKLGGYEFSAPKRIWIRDRLRERLLVHKPDMVISGMALGFDQDLAYVAIEMAIPFVAAVPFVGQERVWPKESKDFYNQLLSKAASIAIVSPGEYSVDKMQVRNEWMVDHCSILIACWDGSAGGTGNCVKYAMEVGREIDRINPNDFK